MRKRIGKDVMDVTFRVSRTRDAIQESQLIRKEVFTDEQGIPEILDVHSIELTPHEYLKEFYERFGFSYIEPAGVVAGHRLIKMKIK